MPARSGRYPSGQRGQTVNLLAYAFGGSNPPLPTIVATAGRTDRVGGGLSEMRVDPTHATTVHAMVCTGREGTRGNSSAVERQPSKLGVAGSNPVSRSRIEVRGVVREAHVAQLAEHALGKGEVSGSIPDMGSRFSRTVVAPFNGR